MKFNQNFVNKIFRVLQEKKKVKLELILKRYKKLYKFRITYVHEVQLSLLHELHVHILYPKHTTRTILNTYYAYTRLYLIKEKNFFQAM